MQERVEIGGLRIAACLHDLIRDEFASTEASKIDAERFWQSLGKIVKELGPANRALLEKRDRLQSQIDDWHLALRREGRRFDTSDYRAFLESIGYIVPFDPLSQPDPSLGNNEDDADDGASWSEIARFPGPQLVVPVDNARYALNAANARWGSLFDALYGSDVIPRTWQGGASGFDPQRGREVIAWAMRFLDSALPLESGSHADISAYTVIPPAAAGEDRASLEIRLEDGSRTALADGGKWVGYREGGRDSDTPGALLFRNHGLHIELHIDREHPAGRLNAAGIKDIVLEAAITAIQDCEDAVCAVDADDKTGIYRNWLRLMKGSLDAEFEKGGRTVKRRLNPDRPWRGPAGEAISLPGRSLMLVRNVGLHMYTDAVLDEEGRGIPEGFLDAMVTALAARCDLYRSDLGLANSREGHLYIVKPKLHGPEEVAATVELFERVEKELDLPHGAIKIGIMDEERRTTVNLGACIAAAGKDGTNRVCFINTGFLDRTGDEIHTSMEAGAVIPKTRMKAAKWIGAYEDWNVDTGLRQALFGKAQIGKGMWAAPDAMAAMMKEKISHPQAGANTAWVPSPTAATLHATHYHFVNVIDRQREIAAAWPRATLDDILAIPLLDEGETLSEEEIRKELDNSVQGILGYVSRWVGQGIGCSKVPDINNIGLMEDRATLRISSQHIANWLHHGIVDEAKVMRAFERMAAIVDRQNEGDPAYRPMAQDPASSIEFQAALELVFSGREQPNGYTEWVLHRRRREVKQSRNH
eukprot:XP_003390420.1 PREDICTED: uncharacterized protein LOC100636345 [Amphimedon queenslandica]